MNTFHHLHYPLLRYPLLPIGMLIVAVLVGGSLPHASAQPPAQQAVPTVEIGTWTLDTVADWESGVTTGLLVSNNAGGELRLDADQVEGGFISQPFATRFPLNAVGITWRTDIPAGTSLVLELRGRETLPPPDQSLSEAGWGPWFELLAGDARSQADDGAFALPDVLEFPPGTSYLQLRARFASDSPRASAILYEITLSYLNTMDGPRVSPGLPSVPISTGPATLTPPPDVVERTIWNARREVARPVREQPRGIILHQIAVTPELTATLALLRAQTAYQTDVLGWEDLVYHYIIDQNGTLYEGRLGGPTARVPRLAGGDTALHIALIGPLEAPPTDAAQTTLVDLLAWVGQAYAIPVTGEHALLQGDQRVTRPNIVGHNTAAPSAPDPGEPLRTLIPELRERADQATIRSRWYFAQGNVADYTQQLAFLNQSDTDTTAEITLFPAGATDPETLSVPIAARGRADIGLNEVVSSTTSLPAMVESNREIVAERILSLPTDLDTATGIPHLSRVWYFAEGSTAESFTTQLVLFNPQTTSTEATITYMREDGSRAEQRALIPARQQLIITVNDVLPATRFGMQVVASQPVAAERVMRFGTGAGGLHTTPGVAQLSRSWFFAEGTTEDPYEMQLLLLNPNAQSTVAAITFMTADGTSLTRRYAIPPTTRLLVDVNEVVPDLGVGTMIDADRPIAVERSLYFRSSVAPEPDASDILTATDSLPQVTPPLVGSTGFGATDPAFAWFFADGPTAATSQYLLLSNPGRSQARVTIEFLLPDGSRPTETVVMPAGSRYTLPIDPLYPGLPALAMVVRATQPIVAERSLFPLDGLGAGGGTTVLGVPGE